MLDTFFVRIFSVPDIYKGHRKATAKTVKKLLVLLPIPLMILMGERLLRSDPQGAVLILLTLLISSFSFILLNKGFLEGTVIYLCSLLTILVTVNTTFVHGIHSVSIISFPTIIIFSGLIIKRLYLIIFSFITILAIFWLGGGEYMAYFTPSQYTSGQPSDLIIALTILLLGLLVIYSLASNLKKSFLQAEIALEKTEQSNGQLQATIIQKNRLIKEVHIQAKTNLHYINLLLEQQENQNLHPLINKIRAIYHTHDTLLVSGKSEFIDFNKYILAYFAYLSDSLSLAKGQLRANVKELYIGLDQVNSLGICFNELIEYAIRNSPSAIILVESFNENVLTFKISAKGLIKLPKSHILFDLVLSQLKADFSIPEDGIGILTLPKNTVEG
ncbi:MAG: hypothetical protein GY816_07235 [Cytophagales bacterium]|nr:hypothetical protein [Cytophagales bacterium]